MKKEGRKKERREEKVDRRKKKVDILRHARKKWVCLLIGQITYSFSYVIVPKTSPRLTVETEAGGKIGGM